MFRDEGEFIDVHLKVGEDVFPAHRIVLAANSDYFHAMFTDGMKESNQEVIELKDESISPDALKIVMNSMYTGDLHVNEENVFEVLAAADHLQVINVVQQCCDFLKKEFIQLRLDLHNYCLLCTVADRYSLKDLQEEAEHKMALNYPEICEREEFLSEINAEQLIRFLSRDYLSAPSETFVFKSVMQWIKHKKEERMAVAAKVIGAVRLGLVDIRVMIEELNRDEMQQVPEIHEILFDAFIYLHAPSHLSKFAEKARPRVTSSVLIAIKPNSQVHYFDFLTKNWKLLPSMARLPGTGDCVCTAHVGNQLYLATNDTSGSTVYCYNVDRNSWERLPHLTNAIGNLCIIGDYMYAISSDHKQVPQRYSFVNRQWQSVAQVNLGSHPLSDRIRDLRDFGLYQCCYSGAEVLHSKLFAIYGCRYIKIDYKLGFPSNTFADFTTVRCFSQAKNKWEDERSEGLKSHFGSSLFLINGRLFIAGGKCSVDEKGIPIKETASVQVYDEIKNTWSVVEQNHIPQNKLGAVEIEGRVYFIINKFPIDSGIRIPPGEVYPVPLGEWENLGKFGKDTVLCYLPVKRGLQG